MTISKVFFAHYQVTSTNLSLSNQHAHDDCQHLLKNIIPPNFPMTT